MKISWNWLRELVELPAGLGPSEVAARMSVSGVAVDGLTEIGKGLSGVIVAEVRGKRPHPKADKLTLVDVFDGQGVIQVVCGAPNVPAPAEPGASPRVAWARPGATLPSGMTLSVRDVRGIPSPGMLCAEDELGLSEDHGGIIVLSPADQLEVGSDFATGAGLPDWIFDLDVTPNRPDLLGHAGVAREVAALFRKEGARLKLPSVEELDRQMAPYLDDTDVTTLAEVEIRDPAGCPRYLAHVIRGVEVRPSPVAVRLRLQRLGVRAISNVVDATNLALLEWGHPLHAFDLATLRGRKIVVRRAAQGEKLKTLDNAERELLHEDVVIADAEQPVAVAGVMGGADSEVRSNTTELLLEAAYFQPASVRRTSRRLRLHTEASHRFERGADPNDMLTCAARRCAQLIVQLGGGRIARGSIDVYPYPMARQRVTLRPERTDAILGMSIDAGRQADHLRALGIEIGPTTAPGSSAMSTNVPTFRPDLTREIDLVEEVMRLEGLGGLPATLPHLHVAPPAEPSAADRRRQREEKARDACTALGLDEVQLFSMLGPDRLQLVGGPAAIEPIRIDNPLREELSAMRTQLLPGLLDALRTNLTHGLADVGLFEVGEVFLPAPTAGSLPDERARVAAVLCGHRSHFLKASAADRLDVHDVRGQVEQLLTTLGYRLRWSVPASPILLTDPAEVAMRATEAGEAPWLHPGVSAVIVRLSDGAMVGSFGEVHPDLRRKLDLDPTIFAFEIEIPDFPLPPRLYQAPSRFPAVERDLSFFSAVEVPAGSLIDALLASQEPLLVGVQLLEDYREAGKVPTGQKGLLFSLTYRSDERTLVDAEVSAAHERVLKRFTERFSVQLRQ